MKLSFPLLVLLAAAVPSLGFSAQVSLDRLYPVSGLPGSIATLFGAGFETGTLVRINGQTASALVVSSNEVNFTIPAGASSGLVAVQVNDVSYTNPVPFTVTRPIQGQFSPPAGLNRAGYQAVADGEFIAIDTSSGSFPGAVAAGEVALISAFRSRSEAAFLALVPPAETQPVLNAASTAEALVLLIVNGQPLVRYTNLIGQLRQLSQLGELTSLIASVSAAGRDYLDDARVLDAWERTVVALLSLSAPSGSGFRQLNFEPGTPSGTRLLYLNPANGYFGFQDLRRLKATLSPPNSERPDDYRLKFESAGKFSPFENPVDWFVKLYELDPAPFTNGLTEVSALVHSDTPLKRSANPLDTASVSASLISKNLDLLDVAAGYVTDAFFGRSLLAEARPGFVGTDEVVIPALRPGVYVAEAYSGNVYFGTELFRDSPPSQSALITQLDARATWGVSLGGNVVVAAVDLIGVMGGFAEVFKKSRSAVTGAKNEGELSTLFQIVDGVAQDVVKGLTIHGNQLPSTDTFYDFVKGAASSILKNLTAKALEDPGFLGEEYGEKCLKLLGKMLDVLGKASSVLQAVERSSGLLANSVLAIERTVVVVGDPFGPKIVSFFPQTGRGGEILTIQGANFSSDTNELNISLRQFASTADPSAFTARLDLEILAATPTSIAVRVPTNGPATFSNGRAFVVVERKSTNLVTSSASLNPPFREFRFGGLPLLTSVFPNPVRPGGILELRGSGFDGETAREHQILIDGQPQTSGWVADDTRMAIVMPPTIANGAHQIAIRLRTFTTPAIQFLVQRPQNDPGSGNPTGQSLTITITQPDFSNVADGKISVLEGILLGKGQLGRPVEQHLPCELLPFGDPNACPFREREVDHVSGLDQTGQGGGPGVTDRISFAAGMIIPGPLPPLSPGDRHIFGNNVVVDGSSAPAGSDGLIFDGLSDVYVAGSLLVRKFSGHGVHLLNGAANNVIEGIRVENCGGSGFMVEGNSTLNRIVIGGVTNVVMHGIHLTGTGTRLNHLISPGGFLGAPFKVISKSGGNGIRVDGGANFNTIFPGTIRDSGAAGIHVSGTGTAQNLFGWITDELARRFDLVNNTGPGAYIGPGAVGNTFRYLNPIGNQGDGVLLEGPGCSNNIVDRTFSGPNLYEGGTSPTITNQGSGIRLSGGAQFNLIGSRLVSLGGYGAICGNRDDGILLEGAGTAFNRVNAQMIGVFNVFASPLRFASNGRSGIALRGGAHDNIIGDETVELANGLFACLDAGIEISGAGTDRNIIYGNQIGSYLTEWVISGSNQDRIGVWIHDGPKANVVGIPGARIQVPAFPGDPFPQKFQFWNAINTCTNAGILLENSGGSVGTDGLLSGANIIQANHIGELDNGNLAPSGATGIKLGPGAEANIVGGTLPVHGNRIRGWRRAGIWIDQNHLSSPRLRNRIENNYIEGPGTGVFTRYFDYATATPVSGIGFLVSDSSGHVIGESQLTRNTIYVNRLGLYLADSSSNVVQGFLITNSFNAGVTVRGGSNNVIGGDNPVLGNLIHAFGLSNEPGWAGLTLSSTANNRIRANEIGYTAPGRGAVGMFITNAANNEIGGPALLNGNAIINNTTNGIVLSGPLARGNQLVNNFIGRDRNGQSRPNRGDGVRLETGARDNFIGGDALIGAGALPALRVPQGNVIADNDGVGVRVVDPTTTGNRILNNEITANGGRGILHENGGNNLMPPPLLITSDGKSVSGTVASLAVTPPGSIIQVFTDPDAADPEGGAWVGSATVGANGLWRVVGTRRYPNLSMTATHAIDGSTSEFGTGTPDVIGLRVFRTDSQTESGIAPGVTRAAVFLLSLNAVNADVRVEELAFDTTGTLPDPSAVAAANLFHDIDTNGVVTDADILLSGPVTFGADDGRITFAGMNPVVEGNSTQRWIVAYSLAGSAPNAATFQVVLTNAQAVVAEFVDLIGLDAQPQGPFAIASATFTVGAAPPGQTFAAWQTGVFTPAQLADPNISGPGADPDGDGVINLLEYAFNLNPLLADRDSLPTGDRGIPQGTIVRAFDPVSQSDRDYLEIRFVRRKEPVDLTYQLEQSVELQDWTDAVVPAAAAFLTLSGVQEVGLPGTLERVTYRSSQPISGTAERFVRTRVQRKP